MNWRDAYRPAVVADVDAAMASGWECAAAERLYDANDARASAPQWDALGDTTRGVWVERARAVWLGDLA
jgi:hypothetical protein